MSIKNFVVKNGLTVGLANIDAATGNLTSGNANLGNLAKANYFQGVFTSASSSQPNITSVGTLTGLTVSGVSDLGPNGNVIITGGTNGQFLQTNGSGNLTWTTIVTSGVSNGTSNIDIPVASGNINLSVAGNANVLVVTGTGVNVAGTLNTGSGIISGNGSGLTSLTGGNVTGQVANALVAGTVYTAAQPNITSVGTLTSVAVTGDGTFGNVYANTGIIGAAHFIGEAGNLSNITAGNITGQVANALVAGTVYTNAQPNITSVGTLTSLTVTGDTVSGNVYANAGVIGALTLKGEGGNISNITGANVTGQVGNALVAGTVYTNAQPNITSVGNLTSLNVDGTANAGNLYTGGILTVVGNANVGNIGATNAVFTGTGSFGANVNMNSKNINYLADPQQAQDAATKAYVDAAVTSLHVHDSCYVATAGTLDAASGGTVSYNNGSSGVGATLTTTGTYLLIDGGNVQTVGTRILVKNEANAAWNGIYVYTSTTVLTRATDFDTSAEAAGGDFVFVTSGTTNADTGWVQTTDNPTLGTSNIVWQQFSGAGSYSAGTGLQLNGTVFSIANTTVTPGTYGNGDRVASFIVNQQGQLTTATDVVIAANAANLTGTTLAATIVNSSLTSVGTLGSLAVTADITAGNVYSNAGIIKALHLQGEGGNIGNIQGANVQGQVANALVAGTVYTAAQPNITSVGTLTSLAVTGDGAFGNVYANAGVISALTLKGEAGNLSNITGANVTGQVGNALVAGTVYTAAQPNITSVGTLTSLDVSGNAGANNFNATNYVTAGNVYANTGIIGAAHFTGEAGNLSNITGGNVAGQVGNALVAGTVYTAAQPNITSVGTLTSLTVSGNLVAGNVDGGNLVKANYVQGTLTTAAQPNITSVGTLTSLTVTGDTVSGNVYANSGMIAAQNLKGEGGNIGNIIGGNVNGQVGNALVAGTVYTNAQPNITSVGTLTSLDVSGNGTFGNVYANAGTVGALLLTGTLTTAAQPNVTSVGTLTSLTTSGNAVVGGNVVVQVGITSNRANVSVPTATATKIDEFAPSTWRTAKYVISASGADGYQSVETLLVHDGVDAYITIYGSICSNVSADIVELSANINGVSGNVTVYATTNSASCVVNLVSSYIKT